MNRTKEERVHEVFENIHRNYDLMNSVISFRLHKSWRQKTMKALDVEKGADVLDLCCGTAEWTIDLAEAAGRSGSVKGVDFSGSMLRTGQEKVNQRGLPQVELLQANVMDLPFPDESFDYVTIGFGLRNAADYPTVLREMHRVLKKGGRAVCLETSMPENSCFKRLYSIYFRHMMPYLGKLFAGNYEEYSWLQESTAAFPNKNLLTLMFAEAGFREVDVTSFAMGSAAAHSALKSS
ncbi:demethylmenaquinone methyltransferase [Salibacterium halotolerans]|uniref:Demethylmenaquinone methyltransferase n=1 Tax=Salibacterium halotolerans TaxID=1884432 RepID=A0A1I5Q5I5_9BACI|nr:demethylmenaquinone methyltransferase [Salibacterium halotolerans]SFP41447.1 demethylmenaquinone methyltransferase / 2-methoxy-6-polyprenyl-1,4-benzoquinol methylase [Salibacterium halotolerans]